MSEPKRYTLRRVTEPRALTIDYASELNPGQLAAVQAVDGPHLVIAGAGTGKTRTLVYRVAYLIENGVLPESILLLSFTRRAAHELMHRSTRLLDARCSRVVGGTFHSFASTALRTNAKLLGLPENFTIVDRGDSEDIISVLRTELGLGTKEKRFPKKNTILNMISREANTGRNLAEIIQDEYPKFFDDLPEIGKLALRYRDYKRENGIFDYDDLLTRCLESLRGNEEFRTKLTNQYRFIMVDEYQDTNVVQAEIASLLAAPGNNLMAVGDDAQSIYSFRGAHFQNILKFPEKYPGCKVLYLEENYRSSQPILDFTNGIIASAREKYDKQLFSNKEGEKPVMLRTGGLDQQSDFICQRILELREEGVPLSQLAVLFRSGWHSNELEIELNARNIPFVKFGGMKFIEAAHIKDMVALLRIVVNPRDEIGWYRILLLMDGVGPKTARKLSEALSRGANTDALNLQTAKYADQVTALVGLTRQLTHMAGQPTNRPEVSIEALLEFYRPLLKANYDDSEKRSTDLESLIRLSSRYERLDEFLVDLALDPPESSQILSSPEEKEDEKLVLSTIHSAKGLEWHSVFMLSLIDGYLPAGQSLAKDSDLEEERRLLYVACTRAKQGLYLIVPEFAKNTDYSYFSGGMSFSQPSRFLEEIARFSELVEQWELDCERY